MMHVEEYLVLGENIHYIPFIEEKRERENFTKLTRVIPFLFVKKAHTLFMLTKRRSGRSGEIL